MNATQKSATPEGMVFVYIWSHALVLIGNASGWHELSDRGIGWVAHIVTAAAILWVYLLDRPISNDENSEPNAE